MDRKRRTNPSFLSDDEAARDRRRTQEMVKSITKVEHPTSRIKEKRSAICIMGTTRVGETDHFIVDFNSKERIVTVYGKEIQTECPFKLALDENEITKIIDLLKKASNLFR